MLLSAFLLLFSLGSDGEANALTFFYLVLILLMGLFLYILITQRKKEEGGDPNQALKKEVDSEIEPDKKGGRDLSRFAGADKGIQYFNTEKFVADLMRQGNKDESAEKLLERILSVIANKFEAVQGIMYFRDPAGEIYSHVANYAYYSDTLPVSFKAGETLPGQVAKNKKLLNIDNVPEGYMTVLSGLGSSYPRNLVIIPLLYQEETVAVIELASFKPFTAREENILEQLAPSLGNDIGNLIKAWTK